MPMTITEKILARTAGLDKVSPGEMITCKVDLICIDEIQIFIFKDTLDKMGTYAVDKDRTVFVIECPEAFDFTDEGDAAVIDVASGLVKNETRGKTFRFNPFSELVQNILLAGRGIHYFKNCLPK